MEHGRKLIAGLRAAALSLVLPALALAQGGPSAPGKGAQPASAAAPADTSAHIASGSPAWLWIVTAVVVLAGLLWALSARRRPAAR